MNKVKGKRRVDKPILDAVTVLQNKNYRQLPKTIEMAFELGVKRLSINGLEPYSENLVENVLWYPPYTPADLSDVLEESLYLANQREVVIGLADFSPAVPSCVDVNQPLIMPNGDVTACAVLAYDRAFFFKVDENNQIVRKRGKCVRRFFGNVFEESLHDVWNNKQYVLFRQNVLNKNFPAECEGCLIKHKFICVRTDTTPESIISQMRTRTHNC